MEEEMKHTSEQEEKGVYHLLRPLMVNGEERKTIHYDFEAITAKDIMQVSRDLKNKGVVVMMARFDDENLMNLFARAVSKADNSVTLNDLMRLSARDTLKITAMTSSFFYGAEQEDTPEN